MSKPERRSVLEGHLVPGRHGAEGKAPLTIAELAFDAAEVLARKGQGAAVRRAYGAGLGLPLPRVGQWMAAGGLTAMGTGPESWLILGRAGEPGALAARLKTMAGSTASIVETGHGLAVFTVSGPHVAEALARICRLDLHPDAFGRDACARTVMAQVPVTLWRMAGESFALAVPLGFAQSFVHTLVTACRSFGCMVGAPEECVP